MNLWHDKWIIVNSKGLRNYEVKSLGEIPNWKTVVVGKPHDIR